MQTKIDARDAEWTAEILSWFTSEWSARYPGQDINTVTSCNYFRPRPAFDDSGDSPYEGFHYKMEGGGTGIFQWDHSDNMSLDEWPRR